MNTYKVWFTNGECATVKAKTDDEAIIAACEQTSMSSLLIVEVEEV